MTAYSYIVNGKIEGFIRQPGYPQLTGKEGDEKITDMYICDMNAVEKLPPYGSFFDGTPRFFAQFKTHRLTERSVKIIAGEQIVEVTLVYSIPPMENSYVPASEAVESFSLVTRDHEIPLEKHPKYLHYWNHDLWSTETSTPAWAKTVKNGELKNDDAKKFIWVKSGELLQKEGWERLLCAKKPGVEAYLTGNQVVVHSRRSTNKKALQSQAKKDYSLEAPKENFGVDATWLRGGTSIQKDGRYWVMNVEYMSGAMIDSELYS